MENIIIKHRKKELLSDDLDIGVTDAEFRAMIIDYLLGKDWYVACSCDQEQVNEIALESILSTFSKSYNKEVAQFDKLRTKYLELKDIKNKITNF